MNEIDPDQIADANLTETIRNQIEAVGPILDRIFQAAEPPQAVWLKGKDARTLASWIIDMQNINMLQEKQIAALYQKLEETGTKPAKKQLWKPI